jgi:hypothetical protein
MSSAAAKLAINRKATQRFIDDDPSDITLIPIVTENRPGGAKVRVDGTPKASQTFKFIYPGGDGIVVTAEGQTRRFDFILVGAYDADLSIGDHWTEGGQNYVVEYVLPFCDYEQKAGGVTHGAAPNHG